MNSIDKFLLWLTMLGSSWYEKLGVDIPQLKSILRVKLMIDNRTALGLYKGYDKKEGTLSDATAISMFISLVFGASFLVFFIFSDDITRLTFYFSSFIFMLAMLIIVNFTSVLFDIRDNYILLPKPVNAATLLISRLLHTLIYLAKLAIPMLLPGLVAIGISRGLWASIFFIPISALVVVFTIFLVNIFYLLLLKFASPQKFNSIISWFQIIFSILIFVLYLLVSRLFQSSVLDNFKLNDQIHLWFLPSYWFAGTWKLLYSFTFDQKGIFCTLLSIGLTLLSAWLIVKYLAPTFQQKLFLISSGTSENTVSSSGKWTNNKFSIAAFIARWFTWNKTEHGAFHFTLKMMARTRDFKFTVYPIFAQIAMPMVVTFIPFLYKNINSGLPISVDDYKLAFVILIYSSCIMYFTALYSLPYSDKFRSAWIFLTMPIEKPGKFFTGVIKACFIKFLVPYLIFISILSLILIGPVIIPNIIFGLCNTLLFSSIISLFTLKEFPFSVSKPNMDGYDTGCFSFIFMACVFLVGALPHYFLFHFPKIMMIISMFTLTAAILVYRSIAKMNWGDLKLDRMLEEEIIN